MSDMTAVIVPKSDQWNFDDFLGGVTMTVTITAAKVSPGTEQPVQLSLSGTKKFYRPGKSMSRVMVYCWGKDSANYIGRSMTLYGDPSVTFGAMKVGGIRISHMSHITGKQIIPLTATKGKKALFTVQPLTVSASSDTDALNADADAAATGGVASYQAFFTGLSNAAKAALLPRHEALKAAAAAVVAKPSEDAASEAQAGIPDDDEV